MVTMDDYGEVDKVDTETEMRWECRSDSGTVRQCSPPKSGGRHGRCAGWFVRARVRLSAQRT